jgi:hypothetical protein
MLHRMKPLPRALLIIALVGGVGFALSKVDFAALTAKKTDTPVAGAVEAPTVTVVTPGQASTQPTLVPSLPVPTPAPVPTQSATPAPLTPTAPSNSGLDALLGAGKK